MGLPRVLGCCAPMLDRGKKWGKRMARYIPGIEDPISGRLETRFPAGENPSPATIPGMPAKLPGVPGHVARCVAIIDDPISGRRGTRFPAGERPVSGHRPRDPGKVAGRAGARGPMCSRYR
jgi:hypothetical protein